MEIFKQFLLEDDFLSLFREGLAKLSHFWVETDQYLYFLNEVLIYLQLVKNKMTKALYRSQTIIPALEHYGRIVSNKKQNQSTLISQQLLIQRQNQLMDQLIKSPQKLRKTKTQMDDTHDFSISTIQNSNMLTASKSSALLHNQHFKITNNFFVEQALKEVRKYCCAATYRLVRDKFQSTDMTHLQSRLHKETKQNQQLMKNCLKLSHQIVQLKAKLQTAGEKIKSLQKVKLTKQKSVNLQKNELFIKWEKSMLHKQKIQSQVKKYLNRQFEILEQEKKVNEEIRQYLLEITDCKTGTTYLNQIFNEIQQNISQQRRLNQMQRIQFVGYQRTLQQIFEQLKNCLNSSK